MEQYSGKRERSGHAVKVHYLCVALQLEQDAGLAGKQELAEAELRHRAALKHAVPHFAPRRAQQARLVVPRLVTACTAQHGYTPVLARGAKSSMHLVMHHSITYLMHP